MTVGGYILFFIACGLLAFFAIGTIVAAENIAVKVVVPIITVVLGIALFAGMHWYYNNTESGKRAFKTQESNFEGGIRRSVKVYDAVGNVIQEYEGTFDVDFGGDEQRILFDDENGMRHVIYFKTGTVIVEEVDE